MSNIVVIVNGGRYRVEAGIVKDEDKVTISLDILPNIVEGIPSDLSMVSLRFNSDEGLMEFGSKVNEAIFKALKDTKDTKGTVDKVYDKVVKE